ncbi:hypothetical protein LINGRAHAP2_LOCUS20683 [Linum grandiflorum]
MKGPNQLSAESSCSNRQLCRHHKPAVVKVSGTARNPGRRFYCCARWKDNDCGFFEWADDLGSDTDMVEELRHQVAVFQLRLATAEDKSHRRKGKIVALKAELSAVRETHKALTSSLREVMLENNVLDHRCRLALGCILFLLVVVAYICGHSSST